MKAIQIYKPGDLRIIDLPKPKPDLVNNVLIRVTASGICGSDVNIYHGNNAAATYPRIIGHEIVGIVEQILSNHNRIKVGDRVIIDQIVSCGHCYACRNGRPNVCSSLSIRGVNIDGGYQQYITVPENDCYLVPSCLTDTEAVMIEPATIAMQCCSRAQVKKDDMVLILGAGVLGSSILRMLKQVSLQSILIADIREERLKAALDIGATYAINPLWEDLTERCRELTNGYGPTLSIDTACVNGSLLSLLQCTGNAGRVITMGFSTAPDEINQFLITSKELDIRGSRLQNRKFQPLINMISAGQLNLKGSVSHTFPFFRVQEAFDLIDSKEPSIRKVVLTF